MIPRVTGLTWNPLFSNLEDMSGQHNGQSTEGAGGHVHLEVKGREAWVTLDHAGKYNAISVQMWRRLRELFEALSDDEGLRIVVIRGAGGHFAAGADISEFPEQRKDLESILHYHEEILAPALRAVEQCIHPTLAWMEGNCIGGGLEIASQCDLRYAQQGSRFGVPINQLGFPLAPSEFVGLLRRVSSAQALEILWLGGLIDDREALRIGLVDQVFGQEEMELAVNEKIQRIAAGPALAARWNKKMARRLSPASPPLTDLELREFFSAWCDSRDHREGVAAFLEKRKPLFE